MHLNFFRENCYNKGKFIKSELVRCANARIREMPVANPLNIDPFKLNGNQTQARMTDILCWKLFPFLWAALLGLQPDTSPGNDILVRTALILNEIQISWRGINESFACVEYTDEMIEDLHAKSFESALLLSKCLGMQVSVRIHRLIWHTPKHIRDSGCRRRGETD